MLNIPNLLTLARLLLLPVIAWLFFMERVWGGTAAWWCFGLYVAAAITDWLDGYLARKMNAVTPFGTFLDPISDKIFVASMLVLLVGFVRLPDAWMICAIVILGREFLISGLREFLGPKNIQIPVSKLAKWKTTSQMIATGILIIGPYTVYGLQGGRWLMVVATILTVITGWDYMKKSLPYLKS